MARATEEDKNILLDSIRKIGDIVSLVDPFATQSIKFADVGIAMENYSSQSVKSEAGLIFLDDRFENLVELLK